MVLCWLSSPESFGIEWLICLLLFCVSMCQGSMLLYLADLLLATHCYVRLFHPVGLPGPAFVPVPGPGLTGHYCASLLGLDLVSLVAMLVARSINQGSPAWSQQLLHSEAVSNAYFKIDSREVLVTFNLIIH